MVPADTGWTRVLLPRAKREGWQPHWFLKHCFCTSQQLVLRNQYSHYSTLWLSYSCFFLIWRAHFYFTHWFEPLTSFLFSILSSTAILGVDISLDNLLYFEFSVSFYSICKCFYSHFVSKPHRSGHAWDSVNTPCYLGIPGMISLKRGRANCFQNTHFILLHPIRPWASECRWFYRVSWWRALCCSKSRLFRTSSVKQLSFTWQLWILWRGPSSISFLYTRTILPYTVLQLYHFILYI